MLRSKNKVVVKYYFDRLLEKLDALQLGDCAADVKGKRKSLVSLIQVWLSLLKQWFLGSRETEYNIIFSISV